MITIGLTVCNEEVVIERVMYNLIKIRPPNSEIMIISDGSIDRTNDIIKDFARKYKDIRLFIKKKRQGKASAINKILKYAQGDIIIFTDGDVIVEENSLEYLLKHFKNPRVGAVGGKPIPVFEKANCLVEGWYYLTHKFWHQSRLEEDKHNNFFLVTGNLFAIRRGIVKKIPENTLIDDALIGFLTYKQGWKIEYEPNATVRVTNTKYVCEYIIQKERIQCGWEQLTHWYKERINLNYVSIIKFLAKELWASKFNVKFLYTILTFIMATELATLWGKLNFKCKQEEIDGKWKMQKTQKEL